MASGVFYSPVDWETLILAKQPKLETHFVLEYSYILVLEFPEPTPNR
jgi:hypothetical protein